MLSSHPRVQMAVVVVTLTGFAAAILGGVWKVVSIYQASHVLQMENHKLDVEWLAKDEVWNRDLIQGNRDTQQAIAAAGIAAEARRQEILKTQTEILARLAASERRDAVLLQALMDLQYKVGTLQGERVIKRGLSAP